jgi:anhydro-N-acetylmuramic acid kinase
VIELNSPQKYTGIGLMSGTSLDGLDIACCNFSLKEGVVSDFNIEKAETIEFDPELKVRLVEAMDAESSELALLDFNLGTWIGKQCISFLDGHNLKPDFISSHGHTVFHQPNQNMTVQIGNGNAIHAITKLPVIWDFRSLDIALGGQGAPLVPIGDEQLFSEYQICLNLGGFANVSFHNGTSRNAYDIGANNIVLNSLAAKLGKAYDPSGQIARSGTMINDLRTLLDNLSFYAKSYPKSLGKEWVDTEVFPLIESYNHEKIENVIHTFTVHIASIIAQDLKHIWQSNFPKTVGKILVTGGGVYNDFLIENIKEEIYDDMEIFIPDDKLVEYKEALIFSLMGLYRLKGLNNCLKSVTGATHDSCTGVVSGRIDVMK